MYCWWISCMECDCWGWVGVECKLRLTVGVKVLAFQLWRANIALYACSDKLKLFRLSSTFWDCWGWGIYVLQRVLFPFLCDSGPSAMIVLWRASIAPYACSDKLGLCCVCSTFWDCCGRKCLLQCVLSPFLSDSGLSAMIVRFSVVPLEDAQQFIC